nr:immunoglobulin heavy chain junction region [Macaca mulatta]MOY18799.1 immunoglobulin heavy chain junction region [Macaca mulatta]MOY18815.1 immunoglobulin heavy chain junction region [Macaca mulatta]MOY19350.1 immunoglobulin heavy chain junction region [Macaca mulatta]MOY19411.1 immunoglobulin heavy chain junction region [Macaca mulatta]
CTAFVIELPTPPFSLDVW